MMVPVVAFTLLLLALALTLGHWRVRLRKSSYERSVRRQWEALPVDAKRRLLADGPFKAGIAAAHPAFPRTARALADEAPEDEVFGAYLSELRGTDSSATSDE